MNASKSKPVFDKRIFWDVNFEEMDYDLRASFIIERVFERGDVQDIRNCRRHYGDDIIRKVLINAKWLSLRTIYLACAVLDNEQEDYRCFNLAQSDPNYFMY